MQKILLFLLLVSVSRGVYQPLEQQFRSNDVIAVDLESENCLVSAYDEDFIYVGCRNRVAIVNAISGELNHPVLYTPTCESLELDCPVNQVLALYPLKKNIMTCFTEQTKAFVCTRFRKANSVSGFMIKPFDENFSFRSLLLTPTSLNPYYFDSRKNLFIGGYLGTPFPEIMKLNLEDESSYTAALKISRGLHDKPQQILAGKPEFIAFIEIEEFMYVFLNEEYLENTLEVSSANDRTKTPNDGLQRARVIRLCANDEPSSFKLWSYFVKAKISCLKNDTLFTRITSVVYDQDASLIFATFSAQNEFIKGSAICTYDVAALNKKFSGDLFEWIPNDELARVANFDPTFQCKFDKSVFPIQNFKLLLQGAIEAQSNVVINDYTAVKTAMKTYVETGSRSLRSVTLSVSNDGYLLRHHFIDSSTVCPLTPFKLTFDLNEPVIDLHLVDSPDPEQLPKLAIVQKSKLTLVPIQNCAVFSSERSCEAAQDPFCFWDAEYSEDGSGKCRPTTSSETGKGRNGCAYQLIPADYSEWSDTYTCANGCECRHKHCMAANFDLLNVTHCPQGPFVMDVSKCPVAGNWSAWSAWSECVNNQRTKERRCDSPEPKYGGQDCVGAKIIYEKCDKQEKPIVPPVLSRHVSDWSTWMIGKVDVNKNRWTETRIRAQFYPPSSSGGNQLETRSPSVQFESMDRNCSLLVSQTCPTSPIMADLLSTWSEWSPCSSACGEGRRIRSRRKCLGLVCNEVETSTEVCKERECPQPQASRTDLLCWSEWTQCSSQCGQGIRTRQRICPSDNFFNCIDGKQSITEDCKGVQCEEEEGLDLLTPCSLQTVEEYGCEGESCPPNSKPIFKTCQLPPEAMLMSQDKKVGSSNSPILYIVVIVATVIFTTIIIILIIFISRRCQGHRHQDVMSEDRPYPTYPLIDMASGISRVPPSITNESCYYGVNSEPLNMSSSNMIPQLWNATQPLGTFNASDQPISNGYNTVDFSFSRQRRQELQETERGSIRFYGTVDNRRGRGVRRATANSFI